MGVGIQIIELLVKTATWIFVIALVARFLAQIARADFYNPLAQTAVKITNPLLLPIRRIVPGLGGMDLAALVLIFLIQLAYASFTVFVVRGVDVAMGSLATWAVLAVVGVVIEVLRWSMIIVAVSSWLSGGNPNQMIGFITQMVDPFVAPFRKLKIQAGMMDFTYLVVFLVLIVLKDILLVAIASSVGYSQQFHLFIGL